MKCEDNLSASAQKRLDLADAELRRVAHITRQSLGFYREWNGPAGTRANEIVESAVELLKPKLDARQVTVIQDLEDDVPIFAVAGEIRQVFSNLLANSLDAVESGGTIRVRLSLRGQKGGRRSVRLTVADSGRGISSAALGHIFDPFFTTKGVVGTGLGLWVTKQIIEKHGGTIRVRSREEAPFQGTTFSIVLPQ